MKSVIGIENDNRILGVFTFVESFHQTAHLIIGKTGRCEERLDSRFPLVLLDEPVVSGGRGIGGQFGCSEGKIVAVVVEDFGKADLFERMFVKESLRRVPRYMWTIETNR